MNPRPWRVVFVCTGNLCRSPMAEGLARDWGLRNRVALEVKSAGTMGIERRPADPKAVAVCAEVGVGIADHRSQGLSDALVDWADYLLVMEVAHAHQIRDRYPQAENRVVLLGSFVGQMDIPDPIGGWTYQFRRSRNQIQRCVEAFLGRLPAAGSTGA